MESDALFINKDCIVDGNKIYLLDLDNRIKIQSVTTGTEQGDWIQISSGLSAGQKAVMSPTNLQEGQKVKAGKIYE